MERALEGVKILDFTHLVQGPFATQMLGDLGADVIKIERTGNGDMMRQLTFLNYRVGGIETPCYLAWNRNKRSIALNLKSPEAKEILYRLAEECDVVVQNFRPGVLEQMGYGYEDFKKINPAIIYCSGSGYGPDGPYVTRPGQDLLLQCLTGLTMVTGRAGGPPTPLGVGIADQIGSYHIAQAILAALYYREKTGKGQEIQVNLYQTLLAHQSQEFAFTLNSGLEFERPSSGIGHPGMPAPFGIYKTSDGWICIAINPIEKVAEVLECEELKLLNDAQVLYDQRDEIFDQIQEIVMTKPTEYWLERMFARDMWVSEVKSYLEVAVDPQAEHLQAFTTYEHPKLGTVKTVNIPIHFSESPGAIEKHPPMVGEHTREILEEAGFTAEDLVRFKQNKVIQHLNIQ